MVGQPRQFFTILDHCSQTFWHVCGSLDIWTCAYWTNASTVEPSIDFQPSYRNAFKYIYKPDKRKFTGIESSRHRLFQRIRRRFWTLKESFASIPTLRLETWTVMYNSASHNQQRFLTSKQLRSGKYTDTMIYGFIRLSAHVEEPERSRIRSELKNVAKFRNMTSPMMTERPLQIPFLAQSDFSKTMKRWLKRYLRPRKGNGIPFHLPTCNIREAAHSKVADTVYNSFNWKEHDLSQPATLPCPCQRLRDTHTRLENIDGHICATLDQFALPTSLQLLTHINSYSTVFPTKQKFIEAATTTFRTWLRKQNHSWHWRLSTVAPTSTRTGHHTTFDSGPYFQTESRYNKLLFIMQIIKIRMPGFFVHNYIFKDVTTHGRTPSFFPSWTWDQNKLWPKCRSWPNHGFKTDTNGASTGAPSYHKDFFSWNERNITRKDGLSSATKVQRLPHCWNLQQQHWKHFWNKYGHRAWDNIPLRKYGRLYTFSFRQQMKISSYIHWMMTFLDFSILCHNTNYSRQFRFLFEIGIPNMEQTPFKLKSVRITFINKISQLESRTETISMCQRHTQFIFTTYQI